MRGVWALWVCVAAWAVEAIDIVARSPVVDVVDGVVQRTQVLTVKCDVTDFNHATTYNLTDSSGASHLMTMTCGEPRYRFALRLMGYVPRDGRLYTNEVCNMRMPTDNSSQAILNQAPAPAVSPLARRLLSVKSKGGTVVLLSAATLGVACGFGWDPLNLCAKHGVSQEDFDRLKNAVSGLETTGNDRYNELVKLNNLTAKWQQQNLDQFGVLEEADKTIEAALNASHLYDLAQDLAQTATADQLLALSTKMKADFNDSYVQIENVKLHSDNITQTLAANVWAAFNSTWLHARDVELEIKTSLNQLVNRTEHSFSGIYVLARALGRGIRDSANGVTRSLLRFDMGRAFVRLFVANVIASKNDGYVPFTDQEGRPPTNNGQIWAPTIESVRFTFVTYPLGGGTRAHLGEFNFTCNALHLLNNVAGSYGWKDFLELMGPSFCDPTLTTVDSHTCRCWGTTSLLQCTAQPGGAESTSFVNSLKLDGTVCSGGISSTREPLQHTSGGAFLDEVGTICNIAANATIFMGAMVANSLLAFRNPSAACSLTFAQLQTAPEGASLAFVALNFWEVAYTKWSLFIDTVVDYFDGVMATGVSFRDEPFQRRGLSMTTCSVGALMTFAPDRLPVYRLDPVSVGVSVTVSVAGVSNVSFTDPVLSAGLANVLPSGGDVVVGDPRSLTVIYNVPSNQLSLSSLASVREDTVTYALQGVNDTFGHAAWEERNGVRFNHFAASNVPELFRALVNNSDGTCLVNGVTYAGDAGGWCDVRALYAVRSSTNDSELVLAPRSSASYLVVVTVPDGSVALSSVSRCPVFGFAPSGLGTLLTFSNPTESQVVFNWTVGGACREEHSGQRLSPGASVQVVVARCAGGPSLLYLSRVSAAGNTSLACPNASGVDITTDVAQYAAQGNADLGFVILHTANSTDLGLEALYRVSHSMQQLILDSIVAQYTMLVSTGLSVNDTAYLAFLRNLNQTNVLIRGIVDGYQVPKYNTTGLDELDAEFRRRFAAAEAARLQADELFRQQMSALSANLDQQREGLKNMNETLEELKEARASYLEAERKWMDAFNNMTKAMLGAFASIKTRPGALVDVLGDVAEGFVDFVVKVAEVAPEAFKELAKAVQDAMPSVGFFDGILNTLYTIAMIIVACIALVLLIKNRQAILRCLGKCGKQGKDIVRGEDSTDEEDQPLRKAGLSTKDHELLLELQDAVKALQRQLKTIKAHQ